MQKEDNNLVVLRTMKDFSEFYQTYIQLVYRIAFHILKNKQDAEDICQDVFMEIYRNPTSYNPDRGSIEAWIAVKTKSRCLDRIKKENRTELANLVEISHLPNNEVVEEQVMKKVTRNAILDALTQIPKPQQDAVFRNFFLNQSHQQLSESMKKPIGTVKSLVRYGLKNMKKHLNI